MLICLRTEVMTKATNSIGVVVGKNWEPITGPVSPMEEKTYIVWTVWIYLTQAKEYVRLSATLNVWQYRSMKHEGTCFAQVKRHSVSVLPNTAYAAVTHY